MWHELHCTFQQPIKAYLSIKCLYINEGYLILVMHAGGN